MKSTSTTVAAVALAEGQDISIYLSGATAHCAVAVQMLHATIERLTEKAMLLRANDVTARNIGMPVWLPRRALTAETSTYHGVTTTTYKLKHWFRPDEYQARVFSRSTVAMLSA